MLKVTGSGKIPPSGDAMRLVSYRGAGAQIGTGAEVGERLGKELRQFLARPETQERFRAPGAAPVGDTPAEFAAFLRNDHARRARVIKASGVTAE